MPMLKNCQFIKIKVDTSEIEGDSVDKDYKGWIEGHSSGGITIISTRDGVRFDNANVLIPINTKTVKLLTQYLTKGEKKIELTVVHRQSDTAKDNYECQKAVYTGCSILSFVLLANEGQTYADITFSFDGTIEMTWEVPKQEGSGVDKVGPVKYSVNENKLM